MTFEIWVQRDDGAAVLTNRLNLLDRRSIQSRDYYLHGLLDAADYESAQDRFVSWCRTRVPDVREHAVDEAAMEAEWKHLMERDGVRSACAAVTSVLSPRDLVDLTSSSRPK